MTRDLLTVTEACERLGISQQTLYSLMHFGQIGWTKVGRGRRFDPVELDRLAKEREGLPWVDTR
jgi:excisionase family DNA binding protein